MTSRRMITHIWESWQFKSMYIMHKKPDTHDTYASMIDDTWQPFTLTQQSQIDPTTPEKKSLLSQSPTRLSDSQVLLQFLSSNSHWSSRWKSIIYWRTSYINLLGSYIQHVISTFNTCSWRATMTQFLTDIDGGYNLRDLGLPHYSPQLS
jgi:hypothetical protein